MFTMGSLFDGIGGFPLAAIHNKIVPLWASEIESFPIKVTKIRFPEMLHVGDITKLNGSNLSAVDVICGGSPCQDLSVAGARAGLAGKRSGLFMEQIRVTKEMRDADEKRGRTDKLIRPRYFVWENVPGAFSSAEGEDFKAVLEETARIADSTVSIPRPTGGLWKSAGCILGDKFSITWRVLDAQYWGVPQRRKRIFLVADFSGHTASKILFEQDSLFGDTKEGKIKRKRIATTTKNSIGDAIKCEINPMLCLNDQGGNRMDITKNITSTLRASMGGNLPIVMGSQQGGAEICENLCPTITSAAGTSGNNQPVLFDNHAKDCRYNGPLNVAPTVAATYGTGGNNIPLVSKESFCIASNIINRQDKNGGNGTGFQKDISYTLTTSDVHAIYAPTSKEQTVFGQSAFADYKKGCNTLRAEGGDNGGGSENLAITKNLVRRLTPLECERLQGFPDGWTNIPKATDSPRYKALGNSVAVPCVDFVLRGIAYFLRKFKNEQED